MIVLWLLSGVGAVVTSDVESPANTPLAAISFIEMLLFALSVGLVGDERPDAADTGSSSRRGAVTLPEAPAGRGEKSFQSGDIVAAA
jgi:hypothetical protein